MDEPAFDIVAGSEFRRWLGDLRDRKAKAVIDRRIQQLARSGVGDLKSVGEGVSELRIDFGPGYRVYLTRRSRRLIFLLCGGDKGSQKRDIARAHALARQTP